MTLQDAQVERMTLEPPQPHFSLYLEVKFGIIVEDKNSNMFFRSHMI